MYHFSYKEALEVGLNMLSAGRYLSVFLHCRCLVMFIAHQLLLCLQLSLGAMSNAINRNLHVFPCSPQLQLTQPGLLRVRATYSAFIGIDYYTRATLKKDKETVLLGPCFFLSAHFGNC